MLSNFGWGEFFFILIIGLIVIGPERLPSVLEDVRAAIYAARKAIANAKRELNGEMGDLEEFRKPIDTMTKYASMGPARAVSSLLFEGDEEYLQSFDPRRVLDDDDDDPRTGRPHAGGSAPRGASGPRPSQGGSTGVTGAQGGPGPAAAPQHKHAGFSWEDVT